MSDEELIEQKKAKRRERERRRRQASVQYPAPNISSSKSRETPWHADGICRRTWERRRKKAVASPYPVKEFIPAAYLRHEMPEHREGKRQGRDKGRSAPRRSSSLPSSYLKKSLSPRLARHPKQRARTCDTKLRARTCATRETEEMEDQRETGKKVNIAWLANFIARDPELGKHGDRLFVVAWEHAGQLHRVRVYARRRQARSHVARAYSNGRARGAARDPARARARLGARTPAPTQAQAQGHSTRTTALDDRQPGVGIKIFRHLFESARVALLS